MRASFIDRLFSYWLGLALITSMLIIFSQLKEDKVAKSPQQKKDIPTANQQSRTAAHQPSLRDSAKADLEKDILESSRSLNELINLNYQNAQLVASRIESNHIALTFDDGPDPETTPKILRELKQYGAKATFFIVGQKVLSHCYLLQRIYTEGHEIANHSYNHPYFTMISLKKQKEEIEKTNLAIQACIPGYQVRWFRPPFGRSNEDTQLLLNKLQLNSALWTIDTEDWRKSKSSSNILDTIASSEGQDIILMHDGVIELPKNSDELPPEIRGGVETLREQFSNNRETTVEALKKFLEENNRLGNQYQFVTLSEAFKLQ